MILNYTSDNNIYIVKSCNKHKNNIIFQLIYVILIILSIKYHKTHTLYLT